MALASDIDKRIAEEQKNIKVESYRDVAWEGTWRMRTNRAWGTGIVGSAVGAAFGAVVPLFTVVGGAATLPVAAALIPSSMAIFSALGITAGFASGVMLGGSAGAASATMGEYERRTRAMGIEQTLRDNPNAQIAQAPSVTPEEKAPAGSFFERAKDAFTYYFNPKVSMTFALIGAAGGLIFAAALLSAGAMAPGALAAAETSFAMPAMKFMLGKLATSAPAVMAYTVGVGATFGSLFGCNFPRITNDVGNFVGDILSGKKVDSPWRKEANQTPLKPVFATKATEPVKENAPQPELDHKPTRFADNEKRVESYRQLAEQPASQEATISR